MCVIFLLILKRPSEINNMLLVPAHLDFGGRTNFFVICYLKQNKKIVPVIFIEQFHHRSYMLLLWCSLGLQKKLSKRKWETWYFETFCSSRLHATVLYAQGVMPHTQNFRTYRTYSSNHKTIFQYEMAAILDMVAILKKITQNLKNNK